jgi:glyoxylase-like metal-dependent hydrolase (beta-lactamase superfamily II)
MEKGDIAPVEGVSDCYYLDTGMYDEAEYGSVYIYDTDRPTLIDAGIGTNYERILDGLEAVGIEPPELELILLTHVHLDHAGGVGYLFEETDADVYVHHSAERFVADPQPLWEGTKEAVGDQIEFYVEPQPVPEDRIHTLEEGDTIDLGGASLEVHHVPGHAFHQVMFHDAAAETVFAADAAGIYSPTLDSILVTSPPPGFDLDAVIEDANAIDALDPETICYAHFGPVEADDRIQEYVDAITDWVDEIERKREELGDDDAVVERIIEASELTELWNETKATGELEMNVRGVFKYLDEQ